MPGQDMRIVERRGDSQIVWAAAKVTGSKVVEIDGYTSLLVLHRITGSPATGGYVSLELECEGNYIPHHGGGAGIPVAASKSDYTAVFAFVTRKLRITCNITDGTHAVAVVPMGA
jgi:hypothetical protein